MPREFSKLTFYVCEPGLHKDSRLGKVSLLYDVLKAKPMTEEQWYPLQYIDADSEIQVDILAPFPVFLNVSLSTLRANSICH